MLNCFVQTIFFREVNIEMFVIVRSIRRDMSIFETIPASWVLSNSETGESMAWWPEKNVTSAIKNAGSVPNTTDGTRFKGKEVVFERNFANVRLTVLRLPYGQST